MRSRRRRVDLGGSGRWLGAAIVGLALLFGGCGGEDETPPQTLGQFNPTESTDSTSAAATEATTTTDRTETTITAPTTTTTTTTTEPPDEDRYGPPIGGEEGDAIAAVLRAIDSGDRLPYGEDGQTFQNREGELPPHQLGYYREYTVETPGSPDRGARRLVIGEAGETYYTNDHYTSFERIDPDEYR